MAANEVSTKMAEQALLQQVTTKHSKKVEVGKRLAEYNGRKREELPKAQKIESEPKLTSTQCYGIGAIMAVGLLGILGYYVYLSKNGDTTKVILVHQSKKGDVTKVTPVHQCKEGDVTSV